MSSSHQTPVIQLIKGQNITASPASVSPRISIVIPAYNEEKRLPSTIADLKSFFAGLALDIEVIVVVEKSEDQTLAVARKSIDNKEIKSDVKFTLIDNKIHRGKGYAVKTGMQYVRGEYVFFCDADLAIPLTEVLNFVNIFQKNPDIDVLIADRNHIQSQMASHQTVFRQKLGQIFSTLVQQLTALPIKDTQCGFKAFRHQVVKSIFPLLECDHFAFDVEVLLLAKHFGYKLSTLPIKWKNVAGSTVNVWIDPIKMLKDLIVIRHRLSKMPPFLSHKNPQNMLEKVS